MNYFRFLIHKSPHPYYQGCMDSPVCSLPRYTLAVKQKYKYNYFFRIKMKSLFDRKPCLAVSPMLVPITKKVPTL